MNETKWNQLDDPRPYIGVIGFAFNHKGKFPILYRSDKVRSAKNAWSLVSGLHEVGRNVIVQFETEALEECNLSMQRGLWQISEKIGFYEAIIPQEGWHWLMALVAMGPFDHSTFVNKEPDKHTDIRFISVDELYNEYINHNWTPNTVSALLRYEAEIRDFVKHLVRYSLSTINEPCKSLTNYQNNPAPTGLQSSVKPPESLKKPS